MEIYSLKGRAQSTFAFINSSYWNPPTIKDILDRAGHEITLPNCYDDPCTEARYRNIGEATFLEMYGAFRMGKKIYLYNDVPTGTLNDEILGSKPIE